MGEASKTCRNSRSKTPKDFTAPGMRRFTITEATSTNHPQPPSGGTNSPSVLTFLTVNKNKINLRKRKKYNYNSKKF